MTCTSCVPRGDCNHRAERGRCTKNRTMNSAQKNPWRKISIVEAIYILAQYSLQLDVAFFIHRGAPPRDPRPCLWLFLQRLVTQASWPTSALVERVERWFLQLLCGLSALERRMHLHRTTSWSTSHSIRRSCFRSILLHRTFLAAHSVSVSIFSIKMGVIGLLVSQYVVSAEKQQRASGMKTWESSHRSG